MEMESKIFYESIGTSDMTIDETSFSWAVDSAIRSRTPSISETSSIPSFASIIDSAIRSRTPSISGISSLYGLVSADDSRTISTRLSQPVSEVKGFESFTLSELAAATNNFSTDNEIGEGSFAIVYRGKLIDGREVAIKRGETSLNNKFEENVFGYRDSVAQLKIQFSKESDFVSRLRHKNLVRLLVIHKASKGWIFLVYDEYMINGSLEDNLHKLQNSALMSWPMRIKVALDVARGIEYLHKHSCRHGSRCGQRHGGDIKSANILFDANWTAKISDFGISYMGSLPGTVGYLDPQYYFFCRFTPKSDVYSFGVVLLELLSGLTAIHKNDIGIPRTVVDFVVPFILQHEIHKVLDPRVPTLFELEAVAYMGDLAADCVRLQSGDRPTMSQVVKGLETALEMLKV